MHLSSTDHTNVIHLNTLSYKDFFSNFTSTIVLVHLNRKLPSNGTTLVLLNHHRYKERIIEIIRHTYRWVY